MVKRRGQAQVQQPVYSMETYSYHPYGYRRRDPEVAAPPPAYNHDAPPGYMGKAEEAARSEV